MATYACGDWKVTEIDRDPKTGARTSQLLAEIAEGRDVRATVTWEEMPRVLRGLSGLSFDDFVMAV